MMNWRLIAVGMAAVLLAGCATAPPRGGARPGQAIPPLQGSYHTVRRGETLWRIARDYGLDVPTLVAANRLPSANEVLVGQQLFIPLPRESARFLWPVRGSYAASGQGLEITAPASSLVRASRSGRVAVATHQLGGWGKTVMVDHLDGYVTVYARLEQILVNPGVFVRQGVPLGVVGARGVHFEIRDGVTPKPTLALLPRE